MSRTRIRHVHPARHRHLVHAVGLGLVCSALCNSGGKVLQRGYRGFPVNASIRDGHALLQASGALLGHLLVALVDVGLDHDADDARLASANLIGHVLGDLGLVAVVLVGVAYTVY